MKRLLWKMSGMSVPFWIGYDCINFVASEIISLNVDKAFVVSDHSVWDMFGDRLLEAMQGKLQVECLLFHGDERSKTLDMVERLATEAINADVSRRSLIVAMGGGLVGNIGGMLAGLLFRGIRLIHIPTTFLAMHDSVTSLKQGVNCNGVKNILGIYHIPTAVYIDTYFLETLPIRHIWSGIVELVKNALIIGGSYQKELETCLNTSNPNFNGNFEHLVYLGIDAKFRFIQDDPHERRRALVFEYGHTVGHAIEITNVGSFTHGEAIACGIWCAGWISAQLGYMSVEGLESHNRLLGFLRNLKKPDDSKSIEEILRTVWLDNKRGYRDRKPETVDMVLLREPGSVLTDSYGFPLTQVPLEVVEASLINLKKSMGIQYDF